MSKEIAIIVGSLRKNSFNRKIAQELIKLAPSSLDMHIVEIGQLPLFNEDLEATPPQEWVSFRQAISKADGVIFCTPEYNRSVPAALKNAIDVGSRPYGHSVWNGKPAAVLSASVSAIGGFGANHHLRQSLVFLNMPCMQQPEAYLGSINTLFNEDGSFKNATTTEFLKTIIDTYANWVNANAKSK